MLWRQQWPHCPPPAAPPDADYAVNTVMITSPSFDRIHHPYDGGADVLLPTSDERDALERRHSDWLSSHPQGL